ncbi:MAG: hypothetical protein H7Y17_11480 [Chlorobia bacterium]|nr:hypothetical protein [Fimbriimonadaceae bacterium]
MKRPSKIKEAFLEGFNTVGLAGAAALSVALLNPLPLLGALVVEAAYLLFVPDSKWYERRLASKYDQEVIDRRVKLRDQIFPSLGSQMQARFSRLEMMRDQIGTQTLDGRMIFREVLRKLDYLLEKFLHFASKEVQFENYLRSVLDEVKHGPVIAPPVQKRPNKKIVFQIEDMSDRDEWVKDTVNIIADKYTGEIEGIEELLSRDENLHNQAVLEKRKEVLTRRSQYVVRIGESLINVSHQLHLMEDTFGLINDEIRARSPEQVLADIEDVVFQTDSLTATLEDVAPFDVMPLEDGARKLYNAPNEK